MSEFTVKIRITDEDIDKDILERTVRVFVTGEDRVWRSGVLEAVSKVIPRENVEAIDKRGRFREWFITVASKNDVTLLDLAGSIRIKGSTFEFCPSDRRRVEFRVHWVPRFLKNDILHSIFSPHGKVISLGELVSAEPGAMNLKNGIRVVRMEVREDKLASIPHLVESEDGSYKLLITSRDRMPLCLKCKCLGHVAGSCLQNPNLYSARLFARDNNCAESSSEESESNSEFSFRQGEEMDRMDVNSEEKEMEIRSTEDKNIQKDSESVVKETGELSFEAQAALVEKMAFSDSWPEQVEAEERKNIETDSEKSKRKQNETNETSVHGKEIKRRKEKKKDKSK
ncbi:hypothetical protein SNE40_023696 [Patella caerulea]|uniref:Uncharacterized protein n=1 Tax=Patella caerulea TaxID=87958 RepID=A0AAN8G310_PATCE